jgi:hypothetical protein
MRLRYHLSTRRVLLICAGLTAIAQKAPAQNCGPWANVSGWQATYSLTATASGAVNDESDLTWTVSNQFTASGNLTLASGICSQEGSSFEWVGVVPTASGSGNVVGSETSGGCLTETLWSGSASSATAFGYPVQLALIINPASNTYQVTDNAVILNATLTETSCGQPLAPTNSLELFLGPDVPAGGGGVPVPSSPYPKTPGLFSKRLPSRRRISFTPVLFPSLLR